jgi:hypothetical protein
MSWIRRIGVLVTLGVACGVPPSSAQDARDEALKAAIERRFDVLPLRDGLALRPKAPLADVRSIEITEGAIAIDGQPATGAELRAKLGADADQVLRLSYLSDAARRSLFAPGASGSPTAPSVTAPVPPVPPAPPTPEITPPPPPEPPARQRRPRSGDRRGDRVRIGGGVTVEEGEVIDGDVVAVGGSVRVDGEVQGDVVAVGGSVTLGPRAVVERNVAVVGGLLHRDPSAQVGGKAQEIALPGLDIDGWTWRRNPLGLWWSSMLGSAFALVGTLVRVAVLCLFAALVVLFGREHMERAGAIASANPLKAGAVGFLAQLLFLPLLVVTCIVLVVTIIGIPLLLLLPFAILGLMVAALIGFAGVSYRIGDLVVQRLGWVEQNPYAVTLIGIVVVMLPVLLSRLASIGGGLMFPIAMTLGIAGAVIEYAAWTVGFGAMALMRFRHTGSSRTGNPGPAIDDATSLPSPSAS